MAAIAAKTIVVVSVAVVLFTIGHAANAALHNWWLTIGITAAAFLWAAAASWAITYLARR